MTYYIQPFREERAICRCRSCGEMIYAGDLAYEIDGECYCPPCIEESAYIADVEDDSDLTDYFERTNVYLPYITQ